MEIISYTSKNQKKLKNVWTPSPRGEFIPLHQGYGLIKVFGIVLSLEQTSLFIIMNYGKILNKCNMNKVIGICTICHKEISEGEISFVYIHDKCINKLSLKGVIGLCPVCKQEVLDFDEYIIDRWDNGKIHKKCFSKYKENIGSEDIEYKNINYE